MPSVRNAGFYLGRKGDGYSAFKTVLDGGASLVGLLIAGFISYGIAFTLSKSDIEARERQAQEQKDNEYQERLPGIKQSIIDEIPGEYTLTNSHASDDEASGYYLSALREQFNHR